MDNHLNMTIAEYENELRRLKAENERLKGLLANNGIDPAPPKPSVPHYAPSALTLEERVTLFRSIFRGREDVFARRWYSKTTGKSGYQPVCQREWNREYCDKKKFKCNECPSRMFEPLGYQHIYNHLSGKDPDGKDVIGLYAITEDNLCYFLCADFDDKSCEHGYQDDVKAYMAVCKDWNIPAYLERSRSGNGAHVWIFFENAVAARDARRLGNAILTESMEREGKMSFKSYDRLFPNQDFIKDGGFGNLVALPLQGRARKNGNSVFVDDDFQVYPNQWGFLQSIRRVSEYELRNLLNLHGLKEELGPLSKSSESAPWGRPIEKPMSKSEFPAEITLILADGIYIPTKQLSPKAVNHLKRMAAFKNPEFYAKFGMRLPIYNLPRIISCSEVKGDYLVMPRGCIGNIVDFFNEHDVSVNLDDKRNAGLPINVNFNGELRPQQQDAVESLLAQDTGTLHATTAFGKTVAGIAMIAERKVNTLILVHTKALLDQWRERLSQFLATDFEAPESPKGRGRRKKFQEFGALSSTENTLNGKIDISLIQSCITDGEVKPFVRDYGMVIVDECHHISAFSFEQVLKEVNARYVYGLTATPIRKDGHQPIIFMRCGPIKFTADSKQQQANQTFSRLLIPRFTSYCNVPEEKRTYTATVADLANDEGRNRLIVADITKVIEEDRTPIVLTGLTSHADKLAEMCSGICPNVIKLIGSDSAKVKRELMQRLTSIPDDQPLMVVATGKYVGEGFDLPRLDTLMLALPVSWKGLIAQYSGRLHRSAPGKTEVRIYDYVDLRDPICESMYRKRLSGYKSVGYSLSVESSGLFAEPKTEAIFTEENFEIPYLNDLTSAKRSIFISCPRLKWRRTPKLIHLLQAGIMNGVSIMVAITEPGHNENELADIGVRIIQSPRKLNCAVIDGHIGWYGSVNFAGRSLPSATAIRLDNPDFCAALIDNSHNSMEG